VRRVLEHDDALIREERGNVLYAHDGNPGDLRRVALRVNVFCDGERFVAESGCAQVAQDADSTIASRGRGGQIMPIHDALANLWQHGETGRPEQARLRPTDLAQLRAVCEAGALAINEGLTEADRLKLVGMDALVEIAASGEPAFVLLEANPRPAGLNHSHYLPSNEEEAGRLGVTRRLWRCL